MEEESLHIDLACGNGDLLIFLKEIYKQSILWGVDSNPTTMAALRLLFDGNYIQYDIHDELNICLDPNTEIFSRSYLPSVESISRMHPFEIGGPIQIILDDINEAKVVRTILGNRKIDSLSWVFPGIGLRSIFEAPYPMADKDRKGISKEEILARKKNLLSILTRNVYKFAAKYLKPGGKFWRVERGLFDPRSITREGIEEVFFDRDTEKYWSSDEFNFSISNPLEVPTPRLRFFDHATDEISGDVTTMQAIVLAQVRNEVEFEEEV